MHFLVLILDYMNYTKNIISYYVFIMMIDWIVQKGGLLSIFANKENIHPCL